jgi:4-alpha-glucanotransferase
MSSLSETQQDLQQDLALLHRGAAACGVELSYTDVWGRTHQTPPDVLQEVLAKILGSRNIERALSQREALRWQRPLDPTLVVRETSAEIEVRIPAARKGASIKLEIEWENGNLQHHWFWLPELRELAAARINGQDYVARRIPLPAPLRLGYHKIRLYWMEAPDLAIFAEAHFIVCPRTAKSVERRLAGLALSLYGLRSQRNWGCGDFTDLRQLVDTFAPNAASFIALNPLHALANRQPYNISPYLPECAFYRNFIYLDVEKVARETAGTLQLLPDTAAEVAALRNSEFVEYERIAKLKLYVLGKVFEHFLALGEKSAGFAEFTTYREVQGQLLEDYATYSTLWEEMHARDANVWLWPDWPKEYQDPRSPEVAAFAKEHRSRILFYQFLQWQLSRQIAEVHAYALSKGMPIGLYHDLALATDRSGADLWAHREFYVDGAKVGAPPDALAPAGQDWGFPPPHREQHREDGYRLFAQTIRCAAAHGGALRIDHVMRFFRLYWIPEQSDATRGTYVTDYAADLLGVIALESVRGNFVVIGEDLGTVTNEVRSALADTGVLSYRLLMFERDSSGRFHSPGEYPAHALVSTTTHDLPTLAGFALYKDIDARLAAGLADEASYQTQKADREREIASLARTLEEAGMKDNPLGLVLATPCLLAAVNQEDLTGETEQQNLPGSTWQYPNWRRKMTVDVEQLGPAAQKFGDAVRRSARIP